MERTDLKDCTHEGLAYLHGEVRCTEDGCMICNNGNWEEKLDIFGV